MMGFHLKTGGDMTETRELSEQDSRSRDWLARLSEACFYITSKSDLNEILQVVVDGACAITGGRAGTVELFDSPALRKDYQASGAGSESGVASDTCYGKSFTATLEAPLLLGSEAIGAVRIYEKEGSENFTPEDEQALQTIAPLATLAISNAIRYWSDRRTKAELEALVEASAISVVVLDVNSGGPLAVNQEARRMFRALFNDGRALEQILEEVTLHRSDGREMAISEVPMDQASGPSETVRSEHVFAKNSDGMSVSLLMNVTPVRLDSGDVVSVVVTFQDATTKEGTERLRSDLLGLVSHELRTPLTTIKGSAATALGSSSPLDAAEMRQFFRIIDQQANHLRNLIRNLHDLARIEDGTLSVSMVPCDVVEILNQAKNTYEGVTPSGTVEIRSVPGLPLVAGDKQRVLQILNSILAYASKFSADSSTVKLGVQQEGSFLELTVEYQSKGFPSADLSTLFAKGPSSGQERVPETHDLDLSVCKGIVEAHGGRIWFNSEGRNQVGKFTFTLPVAEETKEYGGQTWKGGSGADVANLPQVLVLDNDPQTLAYTSDALRAAGFAALVTGSPDEAYRLLEDERPRAILLDLMIPGLEGMEVIERIPKVVDVPVIFLSDRGREHDVERAFEKGGDDYIVKPFLASELIARVRAAIRKRELHSQPKPSEVFQLGEITINYGERTVEVAGRPVQLTATEYKLLFEFSISGGRVLTHDQLLRRVWGISYEGDTRLLRAFVKSLRRKLGDDANSPSYIFTEPGVGYRLAKSQG